MSCLRPRAPRLAALIALTLAGGHARAGEPAHTHAHPHGHLRGACLDPGFRGGRPAYDAPIPGWGPGPLCDRHGHDAGPHAAPYLIPNSNSPYVRTGLYRYPWFGFRGYIPAGPHDDLLYVSGAGPLKR